MKTKYMLPVFAAVFALMFAAATPYVIAEPGQGKDWNDYAKKDIRKDMAEKLNRYCEMSTEGQNDLIEKHNKTEDMVAKMNEYCSLDKEGRQAFIDKHKDQYKRHLDDKVGHKDNKHHHMMVKVEGFTGTVLVPDMSEIEDKKTAHDMLKEQVTVKLSEAAAAAENAGLDVMKGSIGMVVNENDVKSVAWILVAMNMDGTDSEKMSKTIFIVDAADVNKTAQKTKEFDHSMTMKHKEKKYSHGEGYDSKLSDTEKIQDKIAKIEEKLASGTGNAEVDAAKTQFVEILKQLQTAIADGDDAEANSIREQLQDLRNQMTSMKKHN
ncbi:MAG: hypothetical protein OEM28_02790 [Nitrosopumilus sp.]|nr:hypothetical protein [Nitrosopumilus sp.]MDH3487036.1 hypothetical protein [Nitrosopumilus sp.]